MLMELFDTHAHLEEFPDMDAIVSEAKAAGLCGIIGMGMDIPSNTRVLEIASLYPDFIHPALGWYPSNVTAAAADKNLSWLDENLDKAVAVGEIGLDYLSRIRQEVPKELQKQVLGELLALARKHRKPALLHTRYAWADALKAVEEAGLRQVVFHSFTGPSSVLRGILARGWYVSVTPAAAYNPEMQRVVRETPLANLLLETDCPIVFKPERTGEEPPATPAEVRRTLESCAALKGVPPEELAAATTVNARRLLASA